MFLQRRMWNIPRVPAEQAAGLRSLAVQGSRVSSQGQQGLLQLQPVPGQSLAPSRASEADEELTV